MSHATAWLLGKLAEDACQPIVVASHPRSGTHLCIDALRLNFAGCHSWKLPFERADKLYCTLDDWGAAGRVQPEPILRILHRIRRPLIKTHALPALRSIPVWGPAGKSNDAQLARWAWDNSRTIYMYRDGREVMRSFHLFFATAAVGKPQPFREFLREKIDGRSRVRIWANHVESWLAQKRAVCMSMEFMLSNPTRAMEKIAIHIDLPAPTDPRLPSRCDNDMGERIWRRAVMSPMSTAISSRHSCSPQPHWTDVFGPSDREFFCREAGNMLIHLGYEPSDKWVGAERDDTATRPPRILALPSEDARLGFDYLTDGTHDQPVGP